LVDRKEPGPKLNSMSSCSHANMAVNATTLSYCRHDFRRSNHAMVVIRHAIFPRDTASVLGIWREFIANSPVNLDYQNNDAEFANLPGKYAAPKGCVLLADREGEIEGCVAMRQVTHEICEMKRLYVRPQAQGRHLGRALAERLIEEARTVGYSEMRLDVQAKFVPARKLYETLGFVAAEPISFNPVPGASFLGLHL
jgi:putative acetyltransferase